MVHTIDAEVDAMQYEEQAASPSTPAAGFRRLYTMDTRGFEEIDDAGVIRRIGHQYDETDVADPPTDANLDGIFGAPADLEGGFIGIVNDNAGDTDVWLVFTTDSNWYYLQFTQAV